LQIFQVDAFTRRRFAGNPATVVLDADGQSDAAMSAIAREFAHAEVAFVSAATAPDHDLRVRFFNARKEAPFVGHATIAAHAVLLALGRRQFGVLRQAGATGIVEVAAEPLPSGADRADGGTLIEFRQSVPELENPLPSTSLHETLPARVARKGGSRLLVPVGERRALDVLAPNFETLTELGYEIGTDGFFVFAIDRGSGAGEFSTESRMFCPALGIPEDPASGNAHAMLACYLFELGEIDEQVTGFIGLQGRHMQRPAQIHVRLEVRDGGLTAAHIGGGAVIVSEGTLASS
jgi:PhzF family phenazine biosynthesis protein